MGISYVGDFHSSEVDGDDDDEEEDGGDCDSIRLFRIGLDLICGSEKSN